MKNFIKEFWVLLKPYWISEEKGRAYLLLAAIIGLNLGEVYLLVQLNEWNNDFYNALQALDKAAFYKALGVFTYIVFFYIVAAVYRTYLTQMLQIRWRRWMTSHFLDRWLAHRNYYRMSIIGNRADNPDQRISEDINQFIDLTLTLSLGLLSSIVTLLSFLAILWGLSGAFAIDLGGFHLNIPGYMVWAALLYAIVGTWITYLIGRPLVKLNYEQQRYEADFRFSMARLREHSESVALYGGEAFEKESFLSCFSRVVANYLGIMKRQKKLSWFTVGYFQAAIIFPFVVAAPRFFAKEIQLGGLMQIASAFGRVHEALSFIVNSYPSLATWKAVIDRLSGFEKTLAASESLAGQGIATEYRDQPILTLTDVRLLLPEGGILTDHITLEAGKGSSLLIEGPSGTGKSTLFRAVAGLWPFAGGTLRLPKQARLFFLPQKPYLPLGTLRDALCYPGVEGCTDEELQRLLVICGLPYLITRLDEAAAWQQILSPGEQQRIAVARALRFKPDFLFLDEATSSLDEKTEAELYALLKQQLPNTAIISIGHRPALKEFHNQRYTFNERAAV